MCRSLTIFKGSGVALITPMLQDGSVDFDKLKELAEWHVQQGTNAIIACGTTGEASTLDDEEHIAVIEAVVKQVAVESPSSAEQAPTTPNMGSIFQKKHSALVLTHYWL